MIDNNPKFFSFTSEDVINAATLVKTPELDLWIKWYKNLYYTKSYL